MPVELPGGKVVAELVGTFNELTERMGTTALSTCSTRLLFRCLKLSMPLLRALPLGPDGRSPLARALAVACTLADLQVFDRPLLQNTPCFIEFNE